MSLSKVYDPQEAELRLQSRWQSAGIYRFSFAVRLHKSERNLPLGTEMRRLQLVISDEGKVRENGEMVSSFGPVESDLRSITRARVIDVVERLDPSLTLILSAPQLQVTIAEN